MIAIPKLVRKSFGRIPPLPKKLEAVIPFSFIPNDDVFPDHDNGYLKKLLLLEDSVLCTCLSIYQKYVKSVQIYLGNVEAWCNETMEANLFVNHEVFGIDHENSSTLCERTGRKHAKLGPVEGISNIDVTFDILKSKRDRRRLQTCLKFLLSM
mmetsp:Transcript_16795/g.31825  ORF Transcript_16795/g.31825 Transcript_16795/m.31825 type:complete len:153 (+) Transcript_16795:517-975(+)